MVTPEVVGHIDPVCTVVSRRTARRDIDSRHHNKSAPHGAGGRRLRDDRRAGLVGGADRDPAHPAVSDVDADLEAKGVALEGQGCVRVVVWGEGLVNGDVHGGQASCGSVTGASRFLIGLVTCSATRDGIPAVARAARCR
jgi:hypothetical protein